MSVYREEQDGSLTLVRGDTSLAILIENIQQQQEAQGIETSSCLKDTLSFNSNSSTEEI